MAIAVEAAANGERWLWGAPTFDQVRIGWNETKQATAGVAHFTQQRMTAEFPGGGMITYRSLDDPDNARGHTADGIVIDEASEVKEAAWYEVLRPMLVDTGGPGWFLFTPKGRNWVWREHESARDRADSMAWQVPTLGVAVKDGQLVRHPHPLENPDIAFVEIEQLWRTTPQQTFEQEILAAFVEDSGGVFRGVMQAATADRQDSAVDGHEYVLGVDWGRTNDFTVICVVDVTEQALVAMDRFNQIDYTIQSDRLKAMWERFPDSPIYAEENSMGRPIIDFLVADGLPVYPFTTTNQSKDLAVKGLSAAFERNEIRILNDPALIAELQAYEQTRLPSGMIRYHHPEGMHDDCCMALMIAWHAVDNRPWYIW